MDLPFGRWTAHEHLPETPSTNAFALGRARDGAPSGLVVTTDHQTAGRGRLGRRWIDLPRDASLPVSFLIDPPPVVTLVPLAAGLAAADAVPVEGRLKWPNDVLVDDRKLCGILVEAAPDGRLVVGIGTNVDWRGVGHADDRTSIAEVTGEAVDRDRLLSDLAGAFDRRLEDVERDPAVLLADYRRACVTLGRAVRVETPAGLLVGTAEDVDGTGALRLRTGDGILTVRAGDVHHLRALGEREREPEGRTAPLLAVDGDGPAHGLDEHP